jgi:hypothetical protein
LVGVSGGGRGSGLGSGQHPCRRNEDSVRVATVKERSWFCHGCMRMLRRVRRQLHCTFTPVMEARKQHCFFGGGVPDGADSHRLATHTIAAIRRTRLPGHCVFGCWRGLSVVRLIARADMWAGQRATKATCGFGNETTVLAAGSCF